jgi:hypothetical protein
VVATEDGTVEALGLDPANIPEMEPETLLVSEGGTYGDAAEGQ